MEAGDSAAGATGESLGREAQNGAAIAYAGIVVAIDGSARALEGEQLPRIPQASPSLLGVRHRLQDQVPEVRGMVSVGQMGQFMDNYVFDEGWLEHHGAPVKAKGAVGSAASPPLTLVADQDGRPLITA